MWFKLNTFITKTSMNGHHIFYFWQILLSKMNWCIYFANIVCTTFKYIHSHALMLLHSMFFYFTVYRYFCRSLLAVTNHIYKSCSGWTEEAPKRNKLENFRRCWVKKSLCTIFFGTPCRNLSFSRTFTSEWTKKGFCWSQAWHIPSPHFVVLDAAICD